MEKTRTKPKIIEGYHGRYLISPRGYVVDTIKKRLVNSFMNGGYKSVCLRRPGYKKWDTVSIHRLVAHHFVIRRFNHQYVHHIDHDKLNNSVDNLMWTTHSRNIQFYHIHKKASKI